MTKLPLRRLVELVCSQAGDWPAAQECCAALRSTSAEALRGSLVPKKHLERIYMIRLGRNPDVVLGGDRLLDDLRRYRGENVTLTVLELGGRVFGLFFDDRVTKLLSCLVGDDRRVLDPGAYDEPSHVDLTAEERKVLRSGLLMWAGPARMTDQIARCLWFGTAAEFDAEQSRLMSAIEEGVALLPLDWHRILAATEFAFISLVLGAGGDWYIVSGLDEHVTLDHLRSIQGKLAWVRPWPEPYARPGHTSSRE